MRPERLTRRELLSHLRHIVQGVDTGDTLEGSIAWGLPEDDDPDGWDVMGAYRVGNTMGQGGSVVIGQPARQMFGTITTGIDNIITLHIDQALDRPIRPGTYASITLLEPEPEGIRQPDSPIVIMPDDNSRRIEG
jgi:hypothetical protein